MDSLLLKPERMAALQEYAHQHGREPAEVLDDALAKFFDYEAWFAASVEEGVAAADRGEFGEHEEVRRIIDRRLAG
jgi:predicted transcriptional regulator